MATVKITLCRVSNLTDNGETLPVPDSNALAAETLTSSAVSQQGSVTAPVNAQRSPIYWVITSTGHIHVSIATNPVAGPAAGFMVAAGTTRAFAVKNDLEKVAIMDAA